MKTIHGPEVVFLLVMMTRKFALNCGYLGNAWFVRNDTTGHSGDIVNADWNGWIGMIIIVIRQAEAYVTKDNRQV